MSSHNLTSSPKLVLSLSILILATPVVYDEASSVLIYISHVTNEVKHIFPMFLAYLDFFYEVSFHVSCYFSIVSVTLIYKSALNILIPAFCLLYVLQI